MLIQSAYAAARQVFSAPLRGILWKSLALTAALLLLVWFGLTRLFGYFLQGHSISASYPILDSFAFFLAGAGLFVALAYLLPVVSAVVAGYFLDDVAEVVEGTDFPTDPPGRPLPVGRAILYGLRFAGLSLIVNLVALLLFFIPGVNIGVFFVANAYLLGREYFELAAGRFRSPRGGGADADRESRNGVRRRRHPRRAGDGAGVQPADADLRRRPHGACAQAPERIALRHGHPAGPGRFRPMGSAGGLARAFLQGRCRPQEADVSSDPALRFRSNWPVRRKRTR